MEFTRENLIKEVEKEYADSLSKLKIFIDTHITTEAKVGLISGLSIDLGDGASHFLKSLASLHTVDAKTLSVYPYLPEHLNNIAKALSDKQYQVQIVKEKSSLYITLPSVTQERRREMLVEAAQSCEKSKIAVRKIRSKAIAFLKPFLLTKSNVHTTDITKNEAEKFKKHIEALTEKANINIQNTLQRTKNSLLS